MALGLTQALTEVSTRNLLGVKGSRLKRVIISPPSESDCLENMGASMTQNPVGLHGLIQG
jgi:hypothetical protein